MADFTINILGDDINGNHQIGETVSLGDLLYLGTDSKYYKASASAKSSSTTELLMALEDGAINDYIDALAYGYFEDYPFATLVPGSKYYVSTISGKITTSVYTTYPNVSRYVGTAHNSTILFFNPDQSFVSDSGYQVNNVPIAAPLIDHTHTESEITDLDKYTQAEVDALLLSFDGDMVLANAQTNSGIKTFLDTTFKLRNVANTFDGYFVNTNTADRIYTLQDGTGTLAFLTDIFTPSTLLTDYGFTDNSTNWNTAYGWGNHIGLYIRLTGDDSITGEKTFNNSTNYKTNIKAFNTSTFGQAIYAETSGTGDAIRIQNAADGFGLRVNTISTGWGAYFNHQGTGHNIVSEVDAGATGYCFVGKDEGLDYTFIVDKLGNVTGLSFIKTSGTSSQFLKADGSVSTITATDAELNLLDLAGLTAGWVLSADTATTASWKAPAGGGSFLPLAGGIMTGDILMTSNKIIGGSLTTSDLIFQTTTGVGVTGADMHFLVGSNGATEAMTILNNGNVQAFYDITAKINFKSSLSSIILSDTGGQAFRSTLANAWADSQSTRHFQIGTSGANVVFGSASSAIMGRTMMVTNKFQVTASTYNTTIAPTGIFSVVNSSNSNIFNILDTGEVGFGQPAPTAVVHIKAGTATAGTAPTKYTAGTLLSALELGALEFTDDGTNGHLYITLNVAGVLTRVQIV
ncbi:MAG: hypothetical protein ACSLE0_23405 [Chitinophagaceae bacterium]